MVSRIFCFKTGSFPYLKGTAKTLTLTSFRLLVMYFLQLTSTPCKYIMLAHLHVTQHIVENFKFCRGWMTLHNVTWGKQLSQKSRIWFKLDVWHINYLLRQASNSHKIPAWWILAYKLHGMVECSGWPACACMEATASTRLLCWVLSGNQSTIGHTDTLLQKESRLP